TFGTSGGTGAGGTSGAATGGAATGGTAAGGSASGGPGAGGSATGGTGAGGTATGGTASGGSGAGGTATGGTGAGGTATGGTGAGGIFNPPYILGADISWTLQDEAASASYREGGVTKSIERIFANNGFNFVRLRTFVNPSAPGGYAPGQGYCDAAHTITMA